MDGRKDPRRRGPSFADVAASQLSRTRRSTRVKTGCRTCKIRRVKCDECRPSCHRCVSTGRVCDGYGIWDTPSSSPSSSSSGSRAESLARPLPPKARLPDISFQIRQAPAVAGVDLTAGDTLHLEWFVRRTTSKIPGVFDSPFWTTLVVQASCSEPSVLHAVLALGYLHRRDGARRSLTQRTSPADDGPVPDDTERSALQHYSRAIRLLRPHLSGTRKESLRTALTTCIVFVCMELLRGNYMASVHLLGRGAGLASQIADKAAAGAISSGGRVLASPRGDPADDWILEAFARLHIQAALLNPSLAPSSGMSGPANLTARTVSFSSLTEARAHLDGLTRDVLSLAQECRERGMSFDASTSCVPSPVIVRQHIDLQSNLSSWLELLRESECEREGRTDDPLGFVAHTVLLLHYTMVRIMAQTCLLAGDESCYDAHTRSFLSIISRSIELRNLVYSTNLAKTHFEHTSDISPFIIDVGFISPMYYTASKCRNHRLRLQAIRLLASATGTEGIWDGAMATAVATEVARLEEGSFYRGREGINEDFAFDELPSEADLKLPTLPDSRRLRDVRVVFPETPLDGVLLTFRRKNGDGSLGETEMTCLRVA